MTTLLFAIASLTNLALSPLMSTTRAPLLKIEPICLTRRCINSRFAKITTRKIQCADADVNIKIFCSLWFVKSKDFFSRQMYHIFTYHRLRHGIKTNYNSLHFFYSSQEPKKQFYTARIQTLYILGAYIESVFYIN